MVSFIYECLDEMFQGSAIARFLYMRKGGEEVRHAIRMAARFIVSSPFEKVVGIALFRFWCLEVSDCLTRIFLKVIQSRSEA